MVTFNNELETAYLSILRWTGLGLLKCVTIVRDVFGKLSFLFETSSYPDEQQRNELENLLRNDLQEYYGENIYWDNAPAKKRKYVAPVLDLLKEERREWFTERNIIFYISERPIAKKAWVNYPVGQDAVWPYEDALSGRKPRVVTFYSFKGGMGRTTALASVALQLAKKGKNVIMIDTDIEAPGLATLFFDEESIQNGVLDYLLEHSLSAETNISRFVMDVIDPSLLNENDGRLYVLPAGKVDGAYLQKLARIDYQDHREGALRRAMSKMLEAVSEEYAVDYIFIDARAGFHDMGGIAVAQLPHVAVLFGNHSRQSWDGMTQVIRTISESHADNMPIVIVDCMCDSATSTSFIQARERFVQKAYSVFIENYYAEGEALPGIEAADVPHAPVFLPYDPSLRQEIVLYSTGRTEEDERVKAFARQLTTEAYKTVTARIEAWFDEGDLT
ncbi:tyrosine-protein kinase family protein [Eisenbergiella sp.]